MHHEPRIVDEGRQGGSQYFSPESVINSAVLANLPVRGLDVTAIRLPTALDMPALTTYTNHHPHCFHPPLQHTHASGQALFDAMDISDAKSVNGFIAFRDQARPAVMEQPKSAHLPRSGRSNSPFRYPGGKFYARRQILEQIPEHRIYCEPFCGGASVFFAKPPASLSLLNDLDDDVINTLTHIRDHVEALIGMLSGIQATKKNHAYYKNQYKPSNDLERAFRWYYLNRTSYSGIMKAENCYYGYGAKYSMRPENWPPHLRTVADKLHGVEITSLDFASIIDAMPDGTFVFLDPPYYHADQQKFYNCKFEKSDHERLADTLKKHQDRLLFLLTYDNVSEVRDLYNWAPFLSDKEWQYTISRTDDQRNGVKLRDGHKGSRENGRELFIRNYHV